MNTMAEQLIGVRVMAAAIAVATFTTVASAGPLYSIQDGNSTAVFSPDGAGGNGQIDWFVDGVDVIEQQWFYYRLGNTAESPLHALSAPTVTSINTNRDVRDDRLILEYADSTLSVTVDYTLRGGAAGSNSATLGE